MVEIDSATARLAGAVIENTKPTSPAEFYILVIVAGVVLCWGIYWYFKNKQGATQDGGQSGNQQTDEGIYRLHPEDRARLERLEESVKTLADAFREIVRERGVMMEKIGELKGAVSMLIDKH